jgi:hypothetical protein
MLRKIEDAFSDIQHPGDDNIFVYLDPEDVDFGELDYDAFRGLHWKHLTLDFLSRFDIKAVLSYFTKEAFKFYLPGLMSVIVNHPHKTEDNGMRSALVCAMTPSIINDQIMNAHRSKLISLFSQNQRAVFRSFLEFMNAYFPDPMLEREALESTWWQVK